MGESSLTQKSHGGKCYSVSEGGWSVMVWDKELYS